MTGRRTMTLVVALALVTCIGIVGTLLADGGWDRVFFGMTLLPLPVGAGCAWRSRTRSR